MCLQCDRDAYRPSHTHTHISATRNEKAGEGNKASVTSAGFHQKEALMLCLFLSCGRLNIQMLSHGEAQLQCKYVAVCFVLDVSD